MAKNKEPAFQSEDAYRAWSSLDHSLYHLGLMKDREVAKLVRAAIDRLVEKHGEDSNG